MAYLEFQKERPYKIQYLKLSPVCPLNVTFEYALLLSNKSSAVAEMGDRGHNRHRLKRWGGLLCPFRGELGPSLIQYGLGRGLLPYQVASSSIQPFGHNRHGPKIGCAFFSRVAGSPSNIKSPGSMPTSIPNGILVHPAVWPQRTLAENWGYAPLREGELSPHLTHCCVGQGLPPYEVAS